MIRNRITLIIVLWVVSLSFAGFTTFKIGKDIENIGEVYRPDLMMDTQVLYSANKIYKNLSVYSDEGRKVLLNTAYTMDFVIPILFVLALVATTYYFIRNYKNKILKMVLIIIPVLSGIFDILENICMRIVLTNYTFEVAESVSTYAGIFSLLKFIFFIGSLITVVLLLGLRVYRVVLASIRN